MAHDSLMDELEPRLLRPSLPMNTDFRFLDEISEPSLFRPLSANNVFTPPQTSSLTPKQSQCSCCSCKSKSSSPAVLDDSFKELISQQNDELRKLREEVKKLLDYQETLQQKTQLYLNDKRAEKNDECTQTTIMEVSPLKSPKHNYQGLRTPGRSRLTHDQTEITLTFRDLHLETIVEQPPSPQPSVQVSMQEYSDFSRHLDDPNISTSCQSVMDQIQKLLNQAKVADGPQYSPCRAKASDPETRPESDVRRTTVQRLRELGISFIGGPTGKSLYNPFVLPRVDGNVGSDTNQSIEMRMLERKYLGQQMKATFNEQPDAAFSMSTRQYLERYGLAEDVTHFIPPKNPQSNYPGKFLDSMLLRDQPKFL